MYPFTKLRVALNAILGAFALLSFLLALWQWCVGRKFPLHQRSPTHSFPPAVTLLKPLKGSDPFTEDCLRSWFVQDYTGRVQLLFGVGSADDPAGEVVRKLQKEFPAADCELLVCGPLRGANAKVSKLAVLESLARHEIVVISDADVRVPPDFLSQAVAPLCEREVGLVNCFYRLANPSTPAMEWEAIAINADFWSQVLQARTLKPLDFALGAVMVTRREQVREIGGFIALADCLADDYQLGNRIARGGHRIALSTVVVECWGDPMSWREVWKHQLRWARTIRVSQPLPYFFSILSNALLWPVLWVAISPSKVAFSVMIVAIIVRVVTAVDLRRRLEGQSRRGLAWAAWLVPVKDLLQVLIWMMAFAGNRIEWRGEKMHLRRDGTLE